LNGQPATWRYHQQMYKMPVITRSQRAKANAKQPIKMAKEPKSTEQQLAEALTELEKYHEAVNRLLDTNNIRLYEMDMLKKENAKLKKENAQIMAASEKLSNQAARYYQQSQKLKTEKKELENENSNLKQVHKEYKMNLLSKMDEKAKDSAEIWGARC